MITIKCDNCEKLIEAPDDPKVEKVKCPHCGDVNLLPERESKASPTKGLPPDSGPEQSVIKLRPEMFRARPLVFSLLLIALIGGVAGAIYGGSSGNPGVLWGSLILALAAAGIFGFWKVKNLGSSLEITNKRTIERVGLFSRFTSEILHEDVRNVQISQTFAERIMGVGKIGISSAGQDGLEIAVKDIRNPDKIRELIDQYRPM
jgi:phage FluMu protein Com